MFDDKTEHDSFGILQISRISHGAGGTRLFASSLNHHHTIIMRVARAVSFRDLNHTWYGDRKGIVEIEMSNTQFSDAITSLNMGAGTPCTIRYVGSERMPPCPLENERELIHREFKTKMAELAKKFDDDISSVRTILEKKSINKSDREAIIGSMEQVRQEIGSNLSFIHSQFDEAMDKTVVQAKGEVEAFFTNAMIKAGREAIANGMPIEFPALAAPK